jgi:hypothetical protein
MNDANRRAAFLAYFQGTLKGDRLVLRQRTGLTNGRITQLLDPNEPFGERAAMSLAKKLRLREDFFLRPGVADDHPPDRRDQADEALLAKWHLLIPEQQEELQARIDVLVQHNRKAHRQLAAMGLNNFVPDADVGKKLPATPRQKELPIPAPVGRRKK